LPRTSVESPNCTWLVELGTYNPLCSGNLRVHYGFVSYLQHPYYIFPTSLESVKSLSFKPDASFKKEQNLLLKVKIDSVRCAGKVSSVELQLGLQRVVTEDVASQIDMVVDPGQPINQYMLITLKLHSLSSKDLEIWSGSLEWAKYAL